MRARMRLQSDVAGEAGDTARGERDGGEGKRRRWERGRSRRILDDCDASASEGGRNEGPKGIHSLPGCDGGGGGVIRGRKKRRGEGPCSAWTSERESESVGHDWHRKSGNAATGGIGKEGARVARGAVERMPTPQHPACDASPSSPREGQKESHANISRGHSQKQCAFPVALLASLPSFARSPARALP